MADELGLPGPGEVPAWHEPLADLTRSLVDVWSSQGWTWTTGGCFAFAEVFSETFGGEEYGICSFEDDEFGGDYPVEHAVIRVGDAFFDYRGRLDIGQELKAYAASTGREMFLKARGEPGVFWFEDDFMDDDDFQTLREVLARCVPGRHAAPCG